MTFEEELALVLPDDLPYRERLIEKSGRHLQMISAANEYMNLTRISSPREAAIKHVLDSVLPWAFFRDAKRVLDAGTGAGFPGVPLSIVLPEVQFVLSESLGKKARFVETTQEMLELSNVEVSTERAESLALRRRPTIIAVRAVAPVHRLLSLFRKALRAGTTLLLYKGPDVEAELAEADCAGFSVQMLMRYDLPHELGARTLVSVSAQGRSTREAS